jgi:hypothetical protein
MHADERRYYIMSGGTVVVWQMGAGSLICFPGGGFINILGFPDTFLVNPPLQAFIYKTDASGYDIRGIFVFGRYIMSGSTVVVLIS